MKTTTKKPMKTYGFRIMGRIYDVNAPTLRDAKVKFVNVSYEIEILGELKGKKPNAYGFKIGNRIYDIKSPTLRDAKARLVSFAEEIEIFGELIVHDPREKSKIVRGVRVSGNIAGIP